MNTSFEDQVRERAYHIWLAGGMADGHAHEHWVCAEQAAKAAKTTEPVVIITKAKSIAKTAVAAKPKAAKTSGSKSSVAKSSVAKSAKAAGSKKDAKAQHAAH